MRLCIGIISGFPDEEEIRNVRIKRFNNLIDRCHFNMPNIPIIIVAQNGKDFNLNLTEQIEIYNYDKLGITKARETLREIFIGSDYTNMICLDDDFELSSAKDKFIDYIKFIESNQDYFIEYENYLMNLCVIPKRIAEKYQFDTSISAEAGIGYEDGIYVSVIRNTDKYKKKSELGLPAKKRSELVNDKYSTGLRNSDKADLTSKSQKLIRELSAKINKR